MRREVFISFIYIVIFSTEFVVRVPVTSKQTLFIFPNAMKNIFMNYPLKQISIHVCRNEQKKIHEHSSQPSDNYNETIDFMVYSQNNRINIKAP